MIHSKKSQFKSSIRLLVSMSMILCATLNTLAQTDDHGDTPEEATPIEANSETAGSIEVARDRDYFRLETFEEGDISISTLGTTDTHCTLESSDVPNVRNDDGGEGTNCLIEVARQHGIHSILVRAYANNTGDYTLKVGFQSNDISDNEADPHELDLNSSFASRLGRSDDVDYFAVDVEGAGTLQINSEGEIDTIGCYWDDKSDPEKIDWRCNDDDGEDLNFLLEIMATESGRFVFRVEGYEGAIGDYTIRTGFTPATELDDPKYANAVLITASTDSWIYQTRASLVSEAEDTYRLEITQPSDLIVQTNGMLDTQAILFASTDLESPLVDAMDGGEDQNAKVETTVEEGTYFIVVSGTTDTVEGDYQLQVDVSMKSESE